MKTKKVGPYDIVVQYEDSDLSHYVNDDDFGTRAVLNAFVTECDICDCEERRFELQDVTGGDGWDFNYTCEECDDNILLSLEDVTVE